MKNNVYHLTINHKPLTLTLTPPPQWGYCFKCEQETGIRIISERFQGQALLEQKKFCRNCALTNLEELEEGNYQLENKKEVIKEIRTALLQDLTSHEKSEELLECYG
jgi:stress-induced morphogen